MLSFNTGKDILRLIDISNFKTKQRIKYNFKTKKETDFEIENNLDVLNQVDFKEIRKKFHLTPHDMSIIKKCIKKKNCEMLEGVLLKTYNELNDKAKHRIKTCLNFDSYEDRNNILIPFIDKFSILTLQGNSGSGKSFLIAQIIQANLKKDETIYLISRNLKEIDPAFKPFEENIEVIDTTDYEKLTDLDIEDFSESWVIVDDIESLSSESFDVLLLNNLLEMIAHVPDNGLGSFNV